MVGLTAKETGVDIRIIAHGDQPGTGPVPGGQDRGAVREKLGDAVYGVDGQTMEEVVGALLKQRRLKLAVAESCTGGLIGARITNIAGKLRVFRARRRDLQQRGKDGNARSARRN